VFYVVVCAVAQPGPDPVRDEPALLAAAARMIHGQIVPAGLVTDPRAYLWHGPGLVALLAPLVALHVPLPAIRYVDPLLMGGATLLFHRLLRMRLEARPALGWTYAFGLYVPFLSVVPEVHKEPLSILLVIAAMSALTRGLVTGRWLPLIGAGVALGALAMVRLEYGWVSIALLVVAIVWWAVQRGHVTARRLVAVTTVAVATCAPWLAYTYRLTGHPLYWGTSSGISLYWMSPTEHGETGQWHDPRTVRRDSALSAYRALFARVRTLDPVSSDRTLRRQAVANIRARPAQYARNLAANTSRLFFAVPMRPRLSLLRIAADVLFNSLLLAGVVWAAASLWRRRCTLPPETTPIALFTAVAVAVHLPASASPRMLLPIVPPLLWLVAQSVSARKRLGA
jgi:4-amino-4-deoxy-L-arabinose transferase-like glycosyltransferase